MSLELWNAVAEVPKTAQKSIGGGRLKGMTDINPVWRLKTLTEQFGQAGIGWHTQNEKYWVVPSAEGEIAAFCSLELVYKADGEWQAPVSGIGGSMLVENEKAGPHTNDECFKMAYTDALSVACKALGMGANIYWDKGRSGSKYQETPNDEPTGTDDDPLGKNPVCIECRKPITAGIVTFSMKKYGKPLCVGCQAKEKK